MSTPRGLLAPSGARSRVHEPLWAQEQDLRDCTWEVGEALGLLFDETARLVAVYELPVSCTTLIDRAGTDVARLEV